MTTEGKFISELVGRVKLTFKQYHSIPIDGLKHALIKGFHLVMPAPSSKHQNIVVEIITQMKIFVKENNLGNVLTSPIDVKFSEFDSFQPDILFLNNDDLTKDNSSYIDGSPTLIIEVLSPDSEDADYGWKKEISEQYGVNEYWVIDSRYKLIEVFHLEKEKYKSTVFKEGEILRSFLPELSDFKLPIGPLFH